MSAICRKLTLVFFQPLGKAVEAIMSTIRQWFPYEEETSMAVDVEVGGAPKLEKRARLRSLEAVPSVGEPSKGRRHLRQRSEGTAWRYVDELLPEEKGKAKVEEQQADGLAVDHPWRAPREGAPHSTDEGSAYGEHGVPVTIGSSSTAKSRSKERRFHDSQDSIEV